MISKGNTIFQSQNKCWRRKPTSWLQWNTYYDRETLPGYKHCDIKHCWDILMNYNVRSPKRLSQECEEYHYGIIEDLCSIWLYLAGFFLQICHSINFWWNPSKFLSLDLDNLYQVIQIWISPTSPLINSWKVRQRWKATMDIFRFPLSRQDCSEISQNKWLLLLKLKDILHKLSP